MRNVITFSMNDEPHLTPRKEAENPIHYCITEDQLNGASSLYQVTNKTGFIIYESMDYQTAVMLCLDVQDLNKVTVPDAIVLEDKERKLFKNSTHINPRMLTYSLLNDGNIRVYDIADIATAYSVFADKYHHIVFLSGQIHYPDPHTHDPALRIEYIDSTLVMAALYRHYAHIDEGRLQVLGSGRDVVKSNIKVEVQPIETDAVVYDGMIDYKGEAYVLVDNLKEEKDNE